MATKNSSLTVTHLDSVAYLAAYRNGAEARIAKLRLFIAALKAGATTKTIQADAIKAVTESDLVINVASFKAEVGQYITAAQLCKLCRVESDKSLTIARQITTGTVKAEARNLAFKNFSGTDAEFIAIAESLKADTKAPKAKAAPKAEAAPAEAAPEAVTEAEVISPLEDIRAAVKQIRAIMALLESEGAVDDLIEASEILSELSLSMV